MYNLLPNLKLVRKKLSLSPLVPLTLSHASRTHMYISVVYVVVYNLTC